MPSSMPYPMNSERLRRSSAREDETTFEMGDHLHTALAAAIHENMAIEGQGEYRDGDRQEQGKAVAHCPTSIGAVH